MQSVTPLMLKSLRADVDAALAPLLAKYSLAKLRLAKGTYDPNAGSFSFKVEGLAKGGTSPDAMRYDSNQQLLGIPPRPFTFQQREPERSSLWTFTITGLNLTGTKVLCERDDGKTFLFKTDAIIRIATRLAAGRTS